MSEIMSVKTNNEYKKMFGKFFEGRLIKRKHSNSDIVCVQESCGCCHWLDGSWLKEINTNCNH